MVSSFSRKELIMSIKEVDSFITIEEIQEATESKVIIYLCSHKTFEIKRLVIGKEKTRIEAINEAVKNLHYLISKLNLCK